MVTAPVPSILPGLSREECVALAGLSALFLITSAWWVLAFWPVPDAPGWLARTRFVCFGVNDGGLPDAGGWVALIGGPLGMLSILSVGYARAIGRLIQRAGSPSGVALTLVLLGLGAALVITTARRRAPESSTTPSALQEALPAAHQPRLDRPAPALKLSAHDGTVLDLAALQGRPVIVTFAFAHCETVCPLVVKHVIEAQQKLRSTSPRLAVLIVTLDPWRDTPARLAHMAKQWQLPAGDAWILGGSIAEVQAALDRWQIPRGRDLRTGAVTHPALVYVLNGHGRIVYLTSGGADAIVDLVRRL